MHVSRVRQRRHEVGQPKITAATAVANLNPEPSAPAQMSEQEQRYRKIWDSVAAIPPGRVLSYGQVAELAGMPRRARLVSKALKAAPESLQLPWFRVIRSDGSIAFPPGSEGFREQRRRLRAEGTKVSAQGKVESAHRQAAGASGDALDYLLWSPE